MSSNTPSTLPKAPATRPITVSLLVNVSKNLTARPVMRSNIRPPVLPSPSKAVAPASKLLTILRTPAAAAAAAMPTGPSAVAIPPIKGTCPATFVTCAPRALNAPDALAPNPLILAPTCDTMPLNPPTSLIAVLNPSLAPSANCLTVSAARLITLPVCCVCLPTSALASAALCASAAVSLYLLPRSPVVALRFFADVSAALLAF